jgi:hypothetical protein
MNLFIKNARRLIGLISLILLVARGQTVLGQNSGTNGQDQAAASIDKVTGDFNLEDIDDLQTPISPAFTLLGIAPSSIDRPATPKAVGFSLLSSTAKGQGNVPKNVAIEFSPYWLVHHPKLTFTDYYKANVGQTMLQTLSISIGTASQNITNSSGTQDGTGIGVGLAFDFWQGQKSPELDQAVKDLKSAQLDALTSVPDTGPVTISDAKLNAVKAAGDKVRNLDAQRVGFALAFASALTFRVPEKSGESIQADRLGLWLTPGYRFTNSVVSQFTFLGVARYIRDFRQHDDYLDGGGRIVWRSRQMPFSLSGEYLYRRAHNTTSSPRYGILAQYEVNKSWSLIASYGKTFKNDVPQGSDKIAILGINLGLGKTPATPQ